MSNGSRSKWDPAPARAVKPKPTYIGRTGNQRRRKGEAMPVGWCYCCKSEHLWAEVCQ